MDALGNFEPVQGTQGWGDVVVLWNFTDDPGKAVLDALKTSQLVGGEVEVEGVTVVKLGMHE